MHAALCAAAMPSGPIDFTRDSAVVAPRLIGAIVTLDGIGGRIVEVEAYDREDPA